MMIIISGIDGILCPSIFANDRSQDQQSPEFLQQLLAAPVLPWVTEAVSQKFRSARIVIFITGRGVHLNDITATWLRERLGIHSFRIANVNFTTNEQHVNDKIARLEEAISQCAREHASRYECIHVLEDIPAILDWLVGVAADMGIIMVHAIRDGEHQVIYP